MTDKVFNWTDDHPPYGDSVWARSDGDWMLVQLCHRGCCSFHEGAQIDRPQEWKFAHEHPNADVSCKRRMDE